MTAPVRFGIDRLLAEPELRRPLAGRRGSGTFSGGAGGPRRLSFARCALQPSRRR